MSGHKSDTPRDLPLKEMSTPVAREFADMILLLGDIKDSFSAMALWFQRYAPPDGDQSETSRLVGDSLFRDSIVQFVGCFDGTAEFHLCPNNVFGAIDRGVAYFNWLKDIRDSYAAHKFGLLRQCAAGVILDPSGAAVGTGYLVQRGYPLSKEDEKDLLACMSVAGRYLEDKTKTLQGALLREAQAMSPEELMALQNARTFVPESSEIRTSRRKLRNRRRSTVPSTKGSP